MSMAVLRDAIKAELDTQLGVLTGTEAADRLKIAEAFATAIDPHFLHTSGGVNAATAAALGLVKISGTPTDAGNPTVYVKEQTDVLLSGKSNTGHVHSGADITTGTVADARLSSNIPLKNAANFFTNLQTTRRAATGDWGFSSLITTDTEHRWAVAVGGLMEWGAGGTTARDTNLYRSAADWLKTDDNFEALRVYGRLPEVHSTAVSLLHPTPFGHTNQSGELGTNHWYTYGTQAPTHAPTVVSDVGVAHRATWPVSVTLSADSGLGSSSLATGSTTGALPYWSTNPGTFRIEPFFLSNKPAGANLFFMLEQWDGSGWIAVKESDGTTDFVAREIPNSSPITVTFRPVNLNTTNYVRVRIYLLSGTVLGASTFEFRWRLHFTRLDNVVTTPDWRMAVRAIIQDGLTFSGQKNFSSAIEAGAGINIGGTQVLTSGRVLQNVTASAAILTSGTLADARLTSNVPLKDTAGTFSALQTFSAGLTVSGGTLTLPASSITNAMLATGIDWNKVTLNRPTTLAGYGITDASASGHTHTFASLTSKPTTVSGFGIADLISQDGTRFNVNLNTLLTTGFYNVADAPTNFPASATSQYGNVIVARGIDTGLQIYGGYLNDGLWFRGWHTSGSTFTTWRRVIHDGIFNSFGDARYLQLTGGSLTGLLTMNGLSGMFMKLVAGPQGTHGTSSFMQWYRNDGTTAKAYVGFGSNDDTTFDVFNYAGITRIFASGALAATFAATNLIGPSNWFINSGGGYTVYTSSGDTYLRSNSSSTTLFIADNVANPYNIGVGGGAGRVFLNRGNHASSGISFYSPTSSFTAWQMYMGPAAGTSHGVHGNLTVPTGHVVTSWGLRSFIEDVSGYGWTWEAASSSSGSPAIKMELRSSDGHLRVRGGIGTGNWIVGYEDGGTTARWFAGRTMDWIGSGTDKALSLGAYTGFGIKFHTDGQTAVRGEFTTGGVFFLYNGGNYTGSHYYKSNKGSGVYLQNTDTAALQAFSDDGGAAFMSFHRSSAYAVNFGLDPDNTLRAGGWSDGAGNWRFISFPSGAFRIRQDFTADGNATVAGSTGLLVTGGWVRTYNLTGIYNQTHANHFYASSGNYWNVGSTNGSGGTAAYGGIVMRDNHEGTIKGYSGYWDSNGFGFLNNNGHWAVKVNHGGAASGGWFYGSWTISSGGLNVAGNIDINQAGRGYGLVGVYDPANYQAMFAMGSAYTLSTDGTSLGNLYGLAWVYDHPSYRNISGKTLEHGFALAAAGVNRVVVAMNGIWTSGNMYAAAFYTNSSQKLKENIREWKGSALDLFDTVDVVEFNYKADKAKTPKVSFIAELTHPLLAGPKHDSMDHANTLGLLIKAVKELRAQVREQAATIAQLQAA